MRAHFTPLVFLAAAAAGHAQTGTPVPGLAVFDQAMTKIMQQNGIPGGALAITHNGQLVFARGYGQADTNTQTAVQPDSLFRLASLSKPLTAVAMLTLIQQGKLSLTDHPFEILSDITSPRGATPDPRLKTITIAELLQHSGGWDFNVSPDPMFIPGTIAKALGVQSPPSSTDIIRYMLGQPLDFNPGTQYSYSNFGYCVLGRVIEHVSGMSYEQFVRTQVLLPAGITKMRVGNTVPLGKLPGEVNYYDTFDPPTASVFPFVTEPVSVPYGGWYLESLDSAAGWVASSVDYLKFMNAIEGRRGNALLSPYFLNQMTARPSTWTNGNHWYGMGLNVQTTPVPTTWDWWADGTLEGTYTQVVRTFDGSDWVVMFNKWPNDSNTFGQTVNEALWNAYDSISTWPTTDQFASWPDATKAVPSVNAQNGVVSAASYQQGIVPGSWVAIFGDSLSTTSRPWTSGDFEGNTLPTTLSNVSVTVDGKPAVVSYVSPKQINIQVPADTSTGAVVVTVTTNGQATSPVIAEIRPSAPGIFTFGPGLATAVHLNGTVVGDPNLVAGTLPAKPGETILLFGTGFVDSTAGVLIPAAEATSNPVVTVGGTIATVQYTGLVSPGLFQMNLVVPTLPAGAYSLEGTLNGVPFLGSATLTVGN